MRQLLAVALKKVADRVVAEDLVHDSFLSLYKQRDSLAVDVNLSAYLHVVLKNKVYSHYHYTVNQQQYAQYLQQVTTELDNSTQHAIETNELEHLLHQEINKLPQQCKLVFTLSRKEHLSNKEIASRLLISENTVEQHMRRALRQLRGSFTEYLAILLTVIVLDK